MATVAAVILPNDQKKDKTWNVKIRVGHKSKSRYIDTPHFVVKDQLDRKYNLKDSKVIRKLDTVLDRYRDAIGEMRDLDAIDAAELKRRLENLSDNPGGKFIDFMDFIDRYIESVRVDGRDATARTFIRVLNGLKDYFKKDTLDIKDINYKFLVDYERFLRTPRKITRIGNKNTIVETNLKGVGDAGLHSHMRDLRVLFNKCREYYNDEDQGIELIKHYPFKKYKVGQAPETEKRGLTVEQIKAIRDREVKPGSRAELARDLFMLSFYLCGMNAADLYTLEAGEVDRVEYNRSKTSGRRRDKAFISVKLIPEAKDLYRKYAGELQKRYSSITGLNTAIDKGMPDGVDFYAARHSFGDLARNVCRFPVDDVALAMNHKDRSHGVTDIYLSKNWDIVDEVQAGVVKLLE